MRILKQEFLLIITILCQFEISISFANDGHSLKQLNLIIGKLLQSAGYDISIKPDLAIIETENQVAAFHPIHNRIVFEKKALQICRSLKQDSISAMAYLLAHELSHVIQKDWEISPVAFLQHHILSVASNDKELQADVYGAFLCALSGYKIEKMLPALIEKIYSSYPLGDISNSGYPSKATRLKSAKLMIAELNRWILLFEAANILNIEGEHDLAKETYFFLLERYKGPEIYNNIGLAELLGSTRWYHNQWDQFFYPFVLDVHSALYSAQKSRGELSEEHLLLRTNQLDLALNYFLTAFKINPTYRPAWVNVISCLNMMGKPQEAITFFEKLKLKNDFEIKPDLETQKLKIAIGISHALQGKDVCKDYFNQCISSDYVQIKYMAYNNLNVINKKNAGIPVVENCPLNDDPGEWTNLLARKEKPKSSWTLKLPGNEINFDYMKHQKYSRFHLTSAFGPLISVDRIKVDNSKPLNLRKIRMSAFENASISYIEGIEYDYIKCRNQNVLYRLDKKDFVVERLIVTRY